MAIKRFEDIIAWQKAQDLATQIYVIFGLSRDFGFKDQITRAAISISNNIAEGFDRSSDADFSRFLYFALGSCSEVRFMLYLSERLNYLTSEKRNEIIEHTNEVSKIIAGLTKSLSRKQANA